MVLVDGSVFDRKPILSGVPQVSALGQLLLLLYKTDLNSNIVCQVLTFADDIKLYSKANRSNNDNNWEKDLEKLENWTEKCQMSFNFNKVNVYTWEMEMQI